MWYVIGAVLLGAAILLLLNGTAPQLFASVSDGFNHVSNEVGDAVQMIEKDEDLLFDSNDKQFTNFNTYRGSSFELEQNVSVNEWGTNSATRVTGTGGSSRTFFYEPIERNPDEHTVYDLSVYVKNEGNKPMFVTNNINSEVSLEPGETRFIEFSDVGGRIAHFQLAFRTENIGDDAKIVVYNAKASSHPAE